MTLSEFRAARLTQAARDAGADLLVASLPANVLYVSGYHNINLGVLQRTESYALFRPSDGHVSIVGSIAELPSIVEEVGMDADLTLVELDTPYVVDAAAMHSKSHNTPFDGVTRYGRVDLTIRGGRVTYQR